MRPAPASPSRLRHAALAIALLDIAICALLIKVYWFAGHAPAAKARDVVAGLGSAFLCCMTAAPALTLLLMRALPRAALLFALAFPLSLGVFFAALHVVT